MLEPGGVLGRIIDRKRTDVAARLGSASLADLRSRAKPTERSLHYALSRPGARFVMEVKRASPSAGTIRESADPIALARAYAPAADAISVLTDTPFFGGSFADLAAVRSAFSGPILAKDFMIDPRQVAEARVHGADAILIMLSVLDDAEAAAMLEEARRLGMDALVEAHDEVEVRRAVALGAPIIGINNRDLRSLSVDLGVTERLASLVPSDRILVAESGIQTRQDVDRLAPHADAFLVGSSLMRAANPALAARALAYGRVKLCGLTDAHDAEMAASQGASYAGMVFVPNTPRAVTLQTAEPIAQAAHREGIATVGVFRDAKMPDVAETARVLALDAVQLHGSEDTAYINGLRDMLPSGTEIWAAAPVGHAVPPARASADRTLFDTAVNGRSGGTGRAFDWDLLRGHEALQNGFLAGGLGPDNAARAARVGAYGLDVSSGVEMAPGRKDAGKIGILFNALRHTVRKELQSC